jgi:hypothetical protein
MEQKSLVQKSLAKFGFVKQEKPDELAEAVGEALEEGMALPVEFSFPAEVDDSMQPALDGLAEDEEAEIAHLMEVERELDEALQQPVPQNARSCGAGLMENCTNGLLLCEMHRLFEDAKRLFEGYGAAVKPGVPLSDVCSSAEEVAADAKSSAATTAEVAPDAQSTAASTAESTAGSIAHGVKRKLTPSEYGKKGVEKRLETLRLRVNFVRNEYNIVIILMFF